MDGKAKVRQNISAWPELGINYWGINKNASSTLTIHFATLCGEITPTDEDIALGMLAKERMKPRYITQDEAFSNGLKNFAVSRHPLARFKSIYKHLKHPKTVIQQQTVSKARFDPTWTPEEFLEHIIHTFHTGKINKHWRKQVSFIPRHWRLEHIIKLESLSEDWPFDFPAPTIVSNPTVSEDVDIDEGIIYDLYHEDYLSFGYPYQK
jgi:hypothetical protein